VKLDEIRALCPGEGADANTLSAALVTALAKRTELAERASKAEHARRDVLGADDKALLSAERDAAQARLSMDRVDAMLSTIKAQLAAARGRETIAALRADAAELVNLAEAVRAWQRDQYPGIAEAIGAGLHVEQVATTAFAEFHARVDVAYRDPAVREAGALGVELPALNGIRPSLIFPNWQRNAVNG